MFLKGKVISDVFWPTTHQIIKTMDEIEAIPFNCFSVEGTKINNNH